ncbi:MAG: lytic murein transglycosylase [Hyphomicrobiaceae bacterium]|nr:lytic murein transglycosylase [Hyphomicrobiaceae bacterium]
MTATVAAPATGQSSQSHLAPPAGLESFLNEVRGEALAAGVSAATFERATRGLEPDPQVLALGSAQPEFVKPVWDYMAGLVSEARIAAGRERVAQYGQTLAAVERAYGVDRHVVLAIWGVESNFGTAAGERSVIRSLATLAAGDARRPRFWRAELIAALRILEQGDVAPERMTGSWAGAMGHTQFMPTTYRARAVDFDRDGRRDIWGSISDSLASTANYLKASGWRTGDPWGFEVILPDGFDHALSGPGRSQPASAWRRLGVVRPGGVAVRETASPLQLLLPAGAQGPAFLVTGNFRAILRYNPAVAYALAVGHLADRIAGGEPVMASWPVSDRPLARAEREELQSRLRQHGLDTGLPDGIIGNQSRAAIRAFQRIRGLPEDGYPSQRLLDVLRQAGGSMKE